MTTRNKEIELAARAQRIYDDQCERMAVIRQNLHQEWENSAASDAEGREAAWRMLKALNELERSYLTDIDTGKLAQAELEKEDG